MGQITKNKRLTAILITALAAILILGIALGLWHYSATHISINGTAYPRSTTELDLNGVSGPELERIAELTGLEKLDIRDTGVTIPEYEALRAALPCCEIQWSLPFQGGYLDSGTQIVTVSTLTEEDIGLLAYLSELTCINAAGCRDYQQLLILQQRYPDCEVTYDVTIQGSDYSRDTRELTFGSISADELDSFIPHFPELSAITLTDLQTDSGPLLDLSEKHPDIAISWDMEICGVTVNSLAAEIDFSDIRIEDLDALEAAVIRLPRLEKVVMCGCGISNEEMDALNRRHEDIQFVWAVTIRGVTLRTDITQLMPYQYDLWPTTAEAADFRYFTELECLDLGHHHITNCDFVAYMPHMKYLLLGDTRITDLTPLTGLEDIIYLEIFLTGVTDYTPLLTLTNLEDLNLCYTKGQVEVIGQLTWVDYIRWITTDERRLTNAEQEYLRECLPDTLLELGTHQSSTGGEWRKTQNYYDMRDILGMHYMYG